MHMTFGSMVLDSVIFDACGNLTGGSRDQVGIPIWLSDDDIEGSVANYVGHTGTDSLVYVNQ